MGKGWIPTLMHFDNLWLIFFIASYPNSYSTLSYTHLSILFRAYHGHSQATMCLSTYKMNQATPDSTYKIGADAVVVRHYNTKISLSPFLVSSSSRSQSRIYSWASIKTRRQLVSCTLMMWRLKWSQFWVKEKEYVIPNDSFDFTFVRTDCSLHQWAVLRNSWSGPPSSWLPSNSLQVNYYHNLLFIYLFISKVCSWSRWLVYRWWSTNWFCSIWRQILATSNTWWF